MSGHSKWSTIKRQKGATDAKRGNLFTKLSNAISIAVREGGSSDPDFNFKLRLATDKAREANMPKDNIQRAIDKGAGKGEGGVLQTAIFEGFAPSGVAVIVEAITDNTTRTGSEVRNYFSKRGGNLGGPGTVSYMFSRVGEIEVPKDGSTFEQIFEKALEAEALDAEEAEDYFYVYSRPEDLHKVREQLEAAGLKIADATLVYRPNRESMVSLSDLDKRSVVESFLDGLEEMDDVQSVYMNAA